MTINTIFLENLTDELQIIHISGTDIAKFLQGLITNDIYLLNNTNQYLFAAHLNNKGRIIANFIITKIDDNNYYLITPTSVVDILIAKLKIFILRLKITISVNHDFNIIFTNSPTNNIDINNLQHIIGLNNIHCNIKLFDNYQLLLIANISNPIDLNTAANLKAPSNVNWKKFIINHKIPFIYQSTTEAFVPQHINYTDPNLNAVNFKKGCYIGQEIVARLHYLGQTKRSLLQFLIIDDATITKIHHLNYASLIGLNVIDHNKLIVGAIVEHIDNYGLLSVQTEYITADTQLYIDYNSQLLAIKINSLI